MSSSVSTLEAARPISYRRLTLCLLVGSLLCIAAYAGTEPQTREYFMLSPAMGARQAQPAMQPMVTGPEMSAAKWQQAAAASAASAALFLGAQSASSGPFTQSEIASLTYDQIKGTGLANTCPRVEDPSTSAKISVSGGNYKLKNFCLEPTSFQVLEERLTKQGLVTEPVNTKVTTRQTYTLTGIEGTLASEGGKLTFREQDGIDYAASTVPTQTPPTHTDSVRPIQIFWGSSLSCTLFGQTN